MYLYFKSTEEFREMLGMYASAISLASMSEGKDKDAYLNKANVIRKKLVRLLNDNKIHASMFSISGSVDSSSKS